MFEPEIKQAQEEAVAFIEMCGPYDRIPEGCGRLYSWMRAHGLTPAHDKMPAAVFLTMPEETPEEFALWELRAPLASAAAEKPCDETGVGIKRTEACRVASVVHKGSYGSVGPSYDALTAWIAENGYSIAGPPMEVYYSDSDETAPEDYLTEIRFPVADA
ncbi:MAG: GyrI-like domain-containing protein [Coriobacteriia bacterium]|nr:GyrI-like domain-containing protein [Coriobacteriia bacterium]